MAELLQERRVTLSLSSVQFKGQQYLLSADSLFASGQMDGKIKMVSL
jgi:hypothetical protein